MLEGGFCNTLMLRHLGERDRSIEGKERGKKKSLLHIQNSEKQFSVSRHLDYTPISGDKLSYSDHFLLRKGSVPLALHTPSYVILTYPWADVHIH